MRGIERFFVASILLWCAVCSYAATRPRLHGGRRLPDTKEDLSYWKRLLAVVTLSMVRGGGKYTPPSCVARGIGLLVIMNW